VQTRLRAIGNGRVERRAPTDRWLTLSATVLSIAASRIHLDSAERVFAALVAFLYFLFLVIDCVQAIRPRAGFSYGPDPTTLVAHLEHYASYGVKVRIAQSLAAARRGWRLVGRCRDVRASIGGT
jgi:hypothetical protein